SSFDSRELNKVLYRILEAITGILGFEFATIALVDPSQKTIHTAMGVKSKQIPDAVDPAAWVGASHPLEPPEGEKRDIHAWLLREHRRECIITGWDEHFDREIYKKHGHEELIRVFIPIIAQNPEADIGTIEAGYNIKRRNSIDDRQVMMLKA